LEDGILSPERYSPCHRSRRAAKSDIPENNEGNRFESYSLRHIFINKFGGFIVWWNPFLPRANHVQPYFHFSRTASTDLEYLVSFRRPKKSIQVSAPALGANYPVLKPLKYAWLTLFVFQEQLKIYSILP